MDQLTNQIDMLEISANFQTNPGFQYCPRRKYLTIHWSFEGYLTSCCYCPVTQAENEPNVVQRASSASYLRAVSGEGFQHWALVSKQQSFLAGPVCLHTEKSQKLSIIDILALCVPLEDMSNQSISGLSMALSTSLSLKKYRPHMQTKFESAQGTDSHTVDPVNAGKYNGTDRSQWQSCHDLWRSLSSISLNK